jgi:hypothetical protein
MLDEKMVKTMNKLKCSEVPNQPAEPKKTCKGWAPALVHIPQRSHIKVKELWL